LAAHQFRRGTNAAGGINGETVAKIMNARQTASVFLISAATATIPGFFSLICYMLETFRNCHGLDGEDIDQLACPSI